MPNNVVCWLHKEYEASVLAKQTYYYSFSYLVTYSRCWHRRKNKSQSPDVVSSFSTMAIPEAALIMVPADHPPLISPYQLYKDQRRKPEKFKVVPLAWKETHLNLSRVPFCLGVQGQAPQQHTQGISPPRSPKRYTLSGAEAEQNRTNRDEALVKLSYLLNKGAAPLLLDISPKPVGPATETPDTTRTIVLRRGFFDPG